LAAASHWIFRSLKGSDTFAVFAENAATTLPAQNACQNILPVFVAEMKPS